MIYLAYAAAAAAIAVLDQWFKGWIVANLQLFESKPLLPGLVRLTYIQNTGASFSMLSDNRVLLLALTVVCAAVLLYMLFSKHFASPLCRWALVIILGGAIGNMIDRFALGYVVDMFDLEFMDFPIFNIADCFITVGIALFAVYIIADAVKEAKEHKAAEEKKDENADS